MSLQMVQYRSSDLRYPGDDKLRNTTQKNKRKRGSIEVGVIECAKIMSRESPIRNTLMKNNQEEPKKLGNVQEI